MSAQEQRGDEESEEDSDVAISSRKVLQAAMHIPPRELVSVFHGTDPQEVRVLIRRLDELASDLAQDPFGNSNYLRDVMFKARALQWSLNASESEVAEVISLSRFPEGRPVPARTPEAEMGAGVEEPRSRLGGMLSGASGEEDEGEDEEPEEEAEQEA